MSNFQPGWYVVYTRPRHERKVASKCVTMGVGNFLPLIKAMRMWGDRKKYLDVPLFPSYVFVYLKEKTDYFKVSTIEGVWYYLKIGTQLAKVPEKVVNDLRVISDSQYDMEVSHASFQPGRQIQISRGPLVGLSCEVVEFKKKRGLLVRVSLLQRNVLVSLPPEYCASALA